MEAQVAAESVTEPFVPKLHNFERNEVLSPITIFCVLLLLSLKVLEDLESSKPHSIQKSFRREKKHYQAATDRGIHVLYAHSLGIIAG